MRRGPRAWTVAMSTQQREERKGAELPGDVGEAAGDRAAELEPFQLGHADAAAGQQHFDIDLGDVLEEFEIDAVRVGVVAERLWGRCLKMTATRSKVGTLTSLLRKKCRQLHRRACPSPCRDRTPRPCRRHPRLRPCPRPTRSPRMTCSISFESGGRSWPESSGG